MALASVCRVNLDRFDSKLRKDRYGDELLELQLAETNLLNPLQLNLPPYPDPESQLKAFEQMDGGRLDRKPRITMNKGTTTLAFKYQGGIVTVVDSRASQGSYLACNVVKKVISLSKYMASTLAGCAGDCVYWERTLAMWCRIHELKHRERMSVAAASKLFANMLYNYKGMGMSVGAIVFGYDKRGPGLYYVDSEGGRYTGDIFSTGSGSPYAYTVIDTEYRPDMTADEALELGRRAVTEAAFRDGGSGNWIRAYNTTKDGVEEVSVTDHKELYARFQDEKMVE